jgi:glycosyltransferase involved in cell wall biosynthesis
MRVLIVSGIWPPDVGGPASHAPEVAAFLRANGHDVEVVVTADVAPRAEQYPIRWIPRSLPTGVRHTRAAAVIADAARRCDVVYTTGMFARTAAATLFTRTPLVLKLTGDPAFERVRWRGSFSGSLDDFQRAGGAEAAALRALRNATLRRAAAIVCPSSFLRDLVVSWDVAPERVAVVPNPVPDLRAPRAREELRRRLGADSMVVLAFAGRFGPQKALDVAVDAVAEIDGVALFLAGEGGAEPELRRRAAALGDRVRFLGPLSRDHVLDLFAESDASVLPSAWENLPHAVLESLAVGTPVLATAVGGVPEIVEDGVNGLVVPPRDAAAFRGAVARFAQDPALRERLREGAVQSVERFAPARLYGRLESILADAAG